MIHCWNLNLELLKQNDNYLFSLRILLGEKNNQEPFVSKFTICLPLQLIIILWKNLFTGWFLHRLTTPSLFRWMTELFLLSFLISFCCEDYPFPIPFLFHGLCTLVRSAPYYDMLVPVNLCIVIRICAGAAAWLSAKVALEGGNTELVIACPASSLHYRPAQLPLWLSAPSKCAHLLLQESLLTCTLSTCCNHILGRNRCAPSESHPSVTSMSCSAMLGPHVHGSLGAHHAKPGKDRLLPPKRVAGRKQSVSGKSLTHFEGESDTKWYIYLKQVSCFPL